MANAQLNNLTPEQALQDLILDRDLERLEDLLADFNLFDVLGIWHRELQHSSFLAWLLNPRGSHGLRDYFLRGFLSQATKEAQARGINTPTPFDVDGWSFSDVEVTRERHHIDILILSEADGFACLVENKIFSGEIPGQLRSYLNTVEEEYGELKSFPIFLTPEGIEPQEKEDQARYVPVDYQTVAALIDRALQTRGSTISASVTSFLEQYARTLRRHVLGTTDNIQELAYQIYNNHREAIDLIISAKAAPPSSVGLEFVEPAVMQYAPNLQPDWHGKWTRRFFAPGLDEISELKLGEGWTESSRLVLFEFKYTKELALLLWIGPGQQGERVEEIRRRLYDLAKKNVPPFLRTAKFGKFSCAIYWRPLLRTEDYASFNPEQAKPKVEQAIRDFYENDYWPMVNSIRGEFGLGPVTAG